MYSPAIDNLIHELRKLPSVGQRAAERYVFYLLKRGKKEVNELRSALEILLSNTKSCDVCWNFSDTNPCHICSDAKRDHTVLCVVEAPQDIPTIEKTKFRGIYHVLRGTMDMTDIDEVAQQNLKIKELYTRCEKTPQIREVILALNPNLSGETTMLYLEQMLRHLTAPITVSRLARGLPLGGDITYADEVTLTSAIAHRVVTPRNEKQNTPS